MFLDFVESMLGEVPVQYMFVPVIVAGMLLMVMSAILINFFVGIFHVFFYKN